MTMTSNFSAADSAAVMSLRTASAVFESARLGTIQRDPEWKLEAWGTWYALRTIGQRFARERSCELKGTNPESLDALFQKAHIWGGHCGEKETCHFSICDCVVAVDLCVLMVLISGPEASHAA